MKFIPFQPKSRAGVLAIIMFLLAAPILTAFTIQASAQANQLSLADILIGLRSKKVTLTDRNKMLADAIATRGTTFTLTPEIEKELTDTGAGKALLDSIRQRSQMAKNAPPVETKPKAGSTKPEPIVPVPVQDLAFYEKRARESAAKGDLDAALVDYTKAVEMDGSAVSVLMGRGRTYLAKRSFLLAIADFTKVIELEPKNAAAFALRAEANEAESNSATALDDYRKAFELDPTIETAKAAVERFNAEHAKLTAETKPSPQPSNAPPVLPEFIDLGSISEGQATSLVKPIFPHSALQAGFSGQVIVEIELDTKGNVTKAKAISGSAWLRKPSEDAALRSKFKPAVVGTTALKAKARIVYDFVAAH